MWSRDHLHQLRKLLGNLGLVAHHLDIVTRGINNKSPIVVGVILRSQPGRAVVLGPGGQGSLVELVDGLAVCWREVVSRGSAS